MCRDKQSTAPLLGPVVPSPTWSGLPVSKIVAMSVCITNFLSKWAHPTCPSAWRVGLVAGCTAGGDRLIDGQWREHACPDRTGYSD